MTRKPTHDFVEYFSGLLLLFLVITSGCKKSEPTETNLPSREKYDLAYGSDPLQKFDLFLPGGRDQLTKMIIVIHGGGWVSGDKAYCDTYAKRFSGFGFASVSMNYRLANDSVHYREMLSDIDSMIGCIYRNAGQWGIRSGRLALFGYSAGGHLALLYSYSRDKGLHVGAVVSLAGPTDVQDSLLWESPGLYDDIKLMTGDTLPANWTLANPVTFISASNPATLLIHGTNDSVVPVSQSLLLNHVLESSNTSVTLMLLEHETHYFSTAATEQFLEKTKTFMVETLK